MNSGQKNAGELAGKVAVVTGGGTGIGKAIARALSEAGASVVVGGRRAEALEVVARESGCLPVVCDVREERDVAQLFAKTEQQFGGLDILINNAGVTGPVSSAEAMDLTAWDETFAINVRGVILCLKYAVPLLKKRGGGSIVNMSSLMGLRGYPMRSAYAASKFAVIGITESVAQEVGPDKIRVNALCPGAVNGELMQRVIARRSQVENRPPEEIIRVNYTDKAALRRWVEPEEVAAAALFLASDRSAPITGERLRVDAGRM
jgi:NAD(P)-dependent dehydrogenase (short-subunit alcohol dehydrogenase family)